MLSLMVGHAYKPASMVGGAALCPCSPPLANPVVPPLCRAGRLGGVGGGGEPERHLPSISHQDEARTTGGPPPAGSRSRPDLPAAPPDKPSYIGTPAPSMYSVDGLTRTAAARMPLTATAPAKPKMPITLRVAASVSWIFFLKKKKIEDTEAARRLAVAQL